MKTAMGVGRCCCKEEPPLTTRTYCRAWNSEVENQINNLVTLSGQMTSPFVFYAPTNATTQNPESWVFSSYAGRWVTGIGSGTNPSGSFQYLDGTLTSTNPGFRATIAGVSNGKIMLTFVITGSHKISVNPNDANSRILPANNTGRYNNKLSYQKYDGNSTHQKIKAPWEVNFTINDMSGSTELDSSANPETIAFGYDSSCHFRVGGSLFRYYRSSPQRNIGTWYQTDVDWPYNNFELLDDLGQPITATFPCTIRLIGSTDQKKLLLYIDGVKTNAILIWQHSVCHQPYSTQSIRSGLVQFEIEAPTSLKVSTFFQPNPNYPNFTTPDQVLDVGTYNYEIGNGHEEYLTPINWQINSGNLDWNYNSGTGTISANNENVANPTTWIYTRFAFTNISLKPNSIYKIEWLNANVDYRTTPDDHPFPAVNQVFAWFPTGGFNFQSKNRYLESLFFNTNSTGQTLIKFFGQRNSNFDISNIRIWLVYEPLNIVYPSPFTNDATAPATNIDWRLVDGSATITPTINGGKETYTVSVQAGSLPPGCTIDSSTGVITLNPSHTQATYEVGEVTIRVTDFVGEVHDAIYFWERLP